MCTPACPRELTAAAASSFLKSTVNKKKAILLAQDFFTQDAVTSLEATGRVAGIMVLPGANQVGLVVLVRHILMILCGSRQHSRRPRDSTAGTRR